MNTPYIFLERWGATNESSRRELGRKTSPLTTHRCEILPRETRALRTSQRNGANPPETNPPGASGPRGAGPGRGNPRPAGAGGTGRRGPASRTPRGRPRGLSGPSPRPGPGAPRRSAHRDWPRPRSPRRAEPPGLSSVASSSLVEDCGAEGKPRCPTPRAVEAPAGLAGERLGPAAGEALPAGLGPARPAPRRTRPRRRPRPGPARGPREGPALPAGCAAASGRRRPGAARISRAVPLRPGGGRARPGSSARPSGFALRGAGGGPAVTEQRVSPHRTRQGLPVWVWGRAGTVTAPSGSLQSLDTTRAAHKCSHFFLPPPLFSPANATKRFRCRRASQPWCSGICSTRVVPAAPERTSVMFYSPFLLGNTNLKASSQSCLSL